jgi:bifunctional DNA-binding transcriptional regulator/antitoxin component of YhaV-PrlF toxin-antitoxin module
MQTKISTKGQVVLPSSIRRKLGLRARSTGVEQFRVSPIEAQGLTARLKHVTGERERPVLQALKRTEKLAPASWLKATTQKTFGTFPQIARTIPAHGAGMPCPYEFFSCFMWPELRPPS